MIKYPLKLANSLKLSGFINQKQEDEVRAMDGQCVDLSTCLLKEVKNMLLICKEDLSEQKMWTRKFCKGLQDQNTPLLLNLAKKIAKDCGE